jgi:eukaryotic-like serine/threonine-protein kinase
MTADDQRFRFIGQEPEPPQLHRRGQLDSRFEAITFREPLGCAFQHSKLKLELLTASLSLMTIATGTQLGRYEIRSQIGAGGMGEVYLAQDAKLDRKVALKILPADVATDRNRMKRFVQEAKAASALNHPNIITIHEVGSSPTVREGSSTSDETHFIATEFIDGETLRQRMRNAPLKLGVVLDVAAQIASALAAAHAAGIVHRDIKPENIMLRRDGIVKVLDFGLAKLTERVPSDFVDTEAPTSFKTDAGTVVGTASYMSPEQARGLAVDARTDIFSIGVVLYETVTGTLPFEGSTAGEVLAAILSEKEAQPLARYSREVPTELERIVTKAVRKEREQRYQTVKDLLLDLQTLKQQLEFEVRLQRSTPPEGSGGAIVRGGGGTTISEDRGSPQSETPQLSTRSPRSRKAINSLAVLPLLNASADADMEYLSDGITESLINNLSQLPKLRVMARATVFRYQGREVDPQEVGRELGVRAVLTGRVLQRENRLIIKVELVHTADGSQLWGAQYNRQLADIFAVEEEIANEIAEKLRLKLSSTEQKRMAKRYPENTEAYQLYFKGRYYWNKWTAEGTKRAIEYFQQAIAVDPSYALAHAGLADCYSSLTGGGIGLSPAEAFQRARAAAVKALILDDTLPEAHTSLGLIKLNHDWDWSGAEREFKRAIELNPNYPTPYHWYSHYLIVMDRIEESLIMSKRGLELDPLDLEMNAHLAWHHYMARQYDQTIEQCLQTIAMDPNFHETYWFLGWAYARTGQYAKAVDAVQKAIALSGGSSEMTAELGYAFAVSGKNEEARRILSELKELSEREYVSPYFLALIYTGLGEKDQALEWLEKAYQERVAFLIYLGKQPQFDALRSDARFTELGRRVGLP